MIHSRNAWDDTFRRPRRRRRSRAHDLPLLHRRPRRSAARARSRLLPLVQRHRVVQDRRRRARRGRARARRPDAGRDRQPVPRARAAPGQAERARVRRRWSAPRSPRRAASTSSDIADADARERGAGVRRRAVTPSEIQALLKQHGLRPSKALGQNFLADTNMAAHIVRLAGVQPGDHVVEVGPGLGFVDAGVVRSRRARARGRARPPARVGARRRSCRASRSTIVNADALEVDWAELLARSRPLDHGVEPAVQRRDAGRRARARDRADDRAASS